VADGERDVIESLGKNGLRMESVDQIDEFVLLPGSFRRPFD
jgi:hypothetical protein